MSTHGIELMAVQENLKNLPQEFTAYIDNTYTYLYINHLPISTRFYNDTLPALPIQMFGTCTDCVCLIDAEGQCWKADNIIQRQEPCSEFALLLVTEDYPELHRSIRSYLGYINVEVACDTCGHIFREWI